MSLYRRARLALSRGTDDDGQELQPVNQAALDADREEKERRKRESLSRNVWGQPIPRPSPSRAAPPPRPPAQDQTVVVVVNNSPGAVVNVDARQNGPGVARPRRRITEKTTRQVIETTERTIVSSD